MSQQPKSCLPCRVRHSKCDGTVPCAQCRLRNTNCVTSMPGKKDGADAAADGPLAGLSGKALAQSYLDHLRMKPVNRVKKPAEPGGATGMAPKGLTAQYLHTLPVHELLALIKHQQSELVDTDAKIFAATMNHYFDAEEDNSDIIGAKFGLPSDAPGLAQQLVTAYVDRNVLFYPDGKVPVDMVAATATLQRLISGVQFKVLTRAALPDIVDSFAYSVVFTYGAKTLSKLVLAQQLALRTERLLKIMFDSNLSKHPQSVNKVLSLIGFHTIFLLGIGHDDLVRSAISIQQNIALPNRASISATLLSTVLSNVAAITRDVAQRRVWMRAVEGLPAGSIPPYYDAHRIQHWAGEILLQEDGIYPWHLLGQTPKEPELGLRLHLLDHINTAIAKLPSYPPYVFQKLENVERSVKTMFLGAKAITLALLGRMDEAEQNAVEALNTILPEDIDCFTTVLMFSITSAVQVALACRKKDAVVKGLLILNALIPEVPRTARILARMEEHASVIGLSVAPGIDGAVPPVWTATSPSDQASSSTSSTAATDGPTPPPTLFSNGDIHQQTLNVIGSGAMPSRTSFSVHNLPMSPGDALMSPSWIPSSSIPSAEEASRIAAGVPIIPAFHDLPTPQPVTATSNSSMPSQSLSLHDMKPFAAISTPSLAQQSLHTHTPMPQTTLQQPRHQAFTAGVPPQYLASLSSPSSFTAADFSNIPLSQVPSMHFNPWQNPLLTLPPSLANISSSSIHFLGDDLMPFTGPAYSHQVPSSEVPTPLSLLGPKRS